LDKKFKMGKAYCFIILIFCFNCNLLYSQADRNEIKYKIYLKDGGIFQGACNDKFVYIVTEYSTIKTQLSELDSIQVGILPYYLMENKINKYLMQLNSHENSARQKAYDNLISMPVGALPEIRRFIKTNPGTDNNNNEIKYTPQNIFNILTAKYKLNKDFMEMDLIYLNSNFKVGGIFSVRKRMALIKLGSYTIPRENIIKIIFLH
jgi:hypothetical protein